MNVAATESSTPVPSCSGVTPIVIGHRGAAGYRPEHTIAGYSLAMAMGADYVEPDLVLSKDGVLIARHEPAIGGTTDVSAHPEFADRRTTRDVDGVLQTDWFASDFTLAEIKTLRARERLPELRPANAAFDGQFEIPTLDEIIELAKLKSQEAGCPIGIYPEIKHSSFHASLFGRYVLEKKLLKSLHDAYGNTASAPVFIQSFEVANLQYLNRKTRLKLVQLIDADDVNGDGSPRLTAPFDRPYDFVTSGDQRSFADLLSESGLEFVRTYADAIGVWKPYLVKTVDDSGDGTRAMQQRRVEGSTGIIEAAHAKGLLVHAWTFRNDSDGYGFSDPEAEIAYYFSLGVDGVFTDFPETGLAARDTVFGVQRRT